MPTEAKGKSEAETIREMAQMMKRARERATRFSELLRRAVRMSETMQRQVVEIERDLERAERRALLLILLLPPLAFGVGVILAWMLSRVWR